MSYEAKQKELLAREYGPNSHGQDPAQDGAQIPAGYRSDLIGFNDASSSLKVADVQDEHAWGGPDPRGAQPAEPASAITATIQASGEESPTRGQQHPIWILCNRIDAAFAAIHRATTVEQASDIARAASWSTAEIRGHIGKLPR